MKNYEEEKRPSKDELITECGIITIFGEIDDELTKEVIENILWANYSLVGGRPITIMINSCGGSIDCSFAIIDLINSIGRDIFTYVLGYAMSSGSLILMAGDHGYRFVSPNSRTMIHPILWGAHGEYYDFEKQAEEFNIVQTSLIKYISDRTGQDNKKVKKDIQRKKYFSAEETIEYGIADRFLGEDVMNFLLGKEIGRILIDT